MAGMKMFLVFWWSFLNEKSFLMAGVSDTVKLFLIIGIMKAILLSKGL